MSSQRTLLPIMLFFTMIHSETTGIIDKISISESMLSEVNGVYEYLYFDSNSNGSVYYNPITNQYLYPSIYNTTNKVYLISNDASNNTSATSLCQITANTFDPYDCFNHYNGQWISLLNNEWVTETDLRLINCNDICVSQNDNDAFDGTYEWMHFNSTINSSVYQCSNCGYNKVYLYGFVSNTNDGYWLIGFDYRSPNAQSWCILNEVGTNYVFDINDCMNGWQSDSNMALHKCSVNNTTTNPTVMPTLLPTDYITDTLHIPSTILTVSPTFDPTLTLTMYETQYIETDLLNNGLILGFILGLLCCVIPLLIVVLVCFCLYFKRKNKEILQQTKAVIQLNDEFPLELHLSEEIEQTLTPKYRNNDTLTPLSLSAHDSVKSAETLDSAGTLNIEGFNKHVQLEIINDDTNEQRLNTAMQKVLNIKIERNVKIKKLKLHWGDSELSDGMYENVKTKNHSIHTSRTPHEAIKTSHTACLRTSNGADV